MSLSFNRAGHRVTAGLALASVSALLAVAAAAQQAKPPAAAPDRIRPSTAEQRTSRHFERIRHDPPALRAFLQAFPKGADLHNHLTGAVYAESYILWAAEMPLCIDLSTFGIVEAEPSSPQADSAGARPSVTCRDGANQRPASDALRDPALYRSLVDALSTRHWQAARTAGHYQFFDAFRGFGVVAREGRQAAPHIVARSIAEVVHRAARQNVQHLELMMSFDGRADAQDVDVNLDDDEQFRLLRERLTAGGLRDRVRERRQWLDAVEKEVRATLRCGASSASSACSTSIRYMPYALRGLPPQQVFSQALFAFELAAADPRIAGVNLVMPEDWFIPMRDYDLHMRMYRFLREAYPGVNVALHAGELAFGLVPPEKLGQHVRSAIEIAGARRIGHATDVMYDTRPAELLREMARRRVAVEISLSSSDLILGVRGPAHPIRQFLRAGVPVVIATDDEGVARSDLTHEYQRAVEEHGLSYRQIKTISRHSLEHSFLPVDEKSRLKRRLEAAFVAFEAAVK